MLNFRPHKLRVTIYTAGGYSERGVPLPDTETTEEIECRIVPNGSAAQVRFDDGVAHNYSYSIYLNQDCRTFTVGDKVTLIGLDGQPLENSKQFKVLGFFRNQLNARLWV